MGTLVRLVSLCGLVVYNGCWDFIRSEGEENGSREEEENVAYR